jgi:hypothetical protein
MGPGLWTMLLLVPGFHWFAMHRLLGHWNQRIARDAERRGRRVDSADTGLAPLIADLTWGLTVLPWMIVVGMVLVSGAWPEEFPQRMATLCGTGFALAFGVADVAAMEATQRRLVAAVGQ